MKSPAFRPRNTERARELRAALSPAERRLWSYLSRGQLDGHHFTKQFQIRHYYADFACRKQRLVVELDGHSHNMRLKEDAVRDGAMQDEGFRVLRFRNEDVMENAEGVLVVIRAALADQPSAEREGR